MGASREIDGRARGEIASDRLAGQCGNDQLLGEGGQDHVDHRRLQRAADEPAAERAGWELARAVGLHPWLLEQPPVDGELPVVGFV